MARFDPCSDDGFTPTLPLFGLWAEKSQNSFSRWSALMHAHRAASEAEELESKRIWHEAAEAHREASRLFRLATQATGTDDSEALSQLRALSRHHDERARFCEGAEAQEALVKQRKSSAEIIVPRVSKPNNLPPVSTSVGVRRWEPQQSPEEQQWELWKPLEGLMDRLFPSELFGASPPRDTRRESPDFFARESNNMLESFYVVPDYQPGSNDNSRNQDNDESEEAAVLQLTKKETSVLDSVMQGRLLLEDDNAQLRMLVEKLHAQVEKLQIQNSDLSARNNELLKQKQSMRQSVIMFREELGKSVIGRAESPIVTPGLEQLLETEARSVLLSPPPDPLPNRSPSPDMHEYIRNLERKVETQQRKLDDWNKFYREQQKRN